MTPKTRRSGLALRRQPFPTLSLTLSTVGHTLVVVGVWALAALLPASSKVYVVNLVPSVSAKGSPHVLPAPARRREPARQKIHKERPAAQAKESAAKEPSVPAEKRNPAAPPKEPTPTELPVAMAKSEPPAKELAPPKVQPAPKELPVAMAKPEPPAMEPAPPTPKVRPAPKELPVAMARPEPPARELAPPKVQPAPKEQPAPATKSQADLTKPTAPPELPDFSRAKPRLPQRPLALVKPGEKEPLPVPASKLKHPLPASTSRPITSKLPRPSPQPVPRALSVPAEQVKRASVPKGLPAPPKSELSRSKPQLQGPSLTLPRPGKKEEAPLLPVEVRRAVVARGEPRSTPAPAAPLKPARAVQEARSSRPSPPPSGSVDGTAALSMDASDFPYTWYLRQILKKVEDTWTRQAKLASPEQKPLIYVEIRRNGSIVAPKIKKSSGDAFYDQSALRAITDASPFPPLPEEWPKSSLRVLFRFDLRLEG